MGIISNRLKFILAIYQIVAMIYNSTGTCSAQNVSAFFVFGDSMVEAGNNYYINTLAKPMYPYGIDFVKGSPSRRYTNARTIADIIDEELGFKDYSPPFLDPSYTTGDVILKGVNYASAASGILNSTGYIFGQHIGMSEQVDNFGKTRQEIISRIGEAAAKKLLKQALYIVVSIATNDIAERLISPYNYHMGSNYVDEMISQFRSQLTMLYNLDARKIAVTNVPPIGCFPVLKDLFLSDGCVELINKQAQTFNTKLKSLLQELTANLPGSTFVYLDAYAILEDVLQNYKSYGFENGDSACCELLGWHGGLFICTSYSYICEDRSKYVFYDEAHTTDAANLIIAKKMLDGSLKYASPMNLRQLANS